MARKPKKYNHHAARRIAQRNVSPQEIEYVIKKGERFHRAGAVFYYLRDCDLSEEDQKDDERTRLIGTAVVLSKDQNTVLTVWRNRRNGLSHIRRKSKYAYPDWMKHHAYCDIEPLAE